MRKAAFLRGTIDVHPQEWRLLPVNLHDYEAAAQRILPAARPIAA